MQAGHVPQRTRRRWNWTLGLLLSLGAHAQAPVPLTFEQTLQNANYPELVYWFITPETFAPGQAARDIQHLAKDTRFTFTFLTERNGVNFSTLIPPNDYVPASCPQWPPWCTRFAGNGKSHGHRQLN